MKILNFKALTKTLEILKFIEAFLSQQKALEKDLKEMKIQYQDCIKKHFNWKSCISWKEVNSKASYCIVKSWMALRLQLPYIFIISTLPLRHYWLNRFLTCKRLKWSSWEFSHFNNFAISCNLFHYIPIRHSRNVSKPNLHCSSMQWKRGFSMHKYEFVYLWHKKRASNLHFYFLSKRSPLTRNRFGSVACECNFILCTLTAATMNISRVEKTCCIPYLISRQIHWDWRQWRKKKNGKKFIEK